MSLEYLAGLIDADGNIDLTYRPRADGFHPFPKVTIAQRDALSLEKMTRDSPCDGVIYQGNSSGTVHIWEVNGEKAFVLIDLLRDSLYLKAHRAEFLCGRRGQVLSSDDAAVAREDFLALEVAKPPRVPCLGFLSGFVDGDGCFLCEKQNCSRSKLRFRLATTFDPKWMPHIEVMQSVWGGFIRKTKSGNAQWVLGLSSDNSDSFLLPLLANLKVKRYQAILIYYWLSRHLKGKWNTSSEEEATLVKSLLSGMKAAPFSFPVYSMLASYTAKYPVSRGMDYLVMGLAGEAGELCNKWKKIVRGDSQLTTEKATEMYYEVSDVCWYASNICQELRSLYPDEGFSYEGVHSANIDKLFSRVTRGVISGDGDNR